MNDIQTRILQIKQAIELLREAQWSVFTFERCELITLLTRELNNLQQ